MKKEDLLFLALGVCLCLFIASIVWPMFEHKPLVERNIPFKELTAPETGGSEASAPDLASTKLDENRTVSDVLESRIYPMISVKWRF